MNKSEQLIACLEGEIAKRDETIARLEPQLNRAIQANYDLREELAACRVAVENCELFRARIAELEAKTSTVMGVGSGIGNLFVYGDYDSIKAAQKIVIERDQQAQRIGEMEWLLREIGNRCEQRDMPGEQIIAEWSDKIDAALYSR